MRRTLAAASATLVATSLAMSLGHLDAAAATPQTSQAQAALRYLYSQQAAEGSVGGAPGATEDIIIGIADNGFDPATLTKTAAGPSAMDYLQAQTVAHKTDATAGGTAKLILALVAAKRDPTNFGGADLITTLAGYRQPNGLFHSTATDPATGKPVEVANAFAQAFAVLADLAARQPLPLHAVGWLVCAQLPDGGFGYYITDAASSPPASCGDTADGSDSNDTAIILQALNAANKFTADSAARTYLGGIQNPDGGFPSYDGMGTPVPSDPDSDAIVVQALVAMNLDPATFTKSGKNPIANLESFQDAQNGGFTQPPNSTPDAFTTSQVPAALALAPYATRTHFAAGSSPVAAAVSPITPAPAASSTPTSAPPLGAAITVPNTGGEAPLGGGAALLAAGAGLLGLIGWRSRRLRLAD